MNTETSNYQDSRCWKQFYRAAVLEGYLTTPTTSQFFILETTLCEHFEKAVAA